ncbi:MAG: hypothetical protein ACLPY5_02615 [Candidatus Bathyarchaeia archaeon]
MSNSAKKQLDGSKIRNAILNIVSRYKDEDPNLQSGLVVREACRQLGVEGRKEIEQAVLTTWYDLFRTGQIAWGFDASNPDPPFCHVTEHGREMLKALSRDPANPEGYMNHLSQLCTVNAISKSYLSEALKTYNSDCVKAAAVMVGAAAESILLELRDGIKAKLLAATRSPPSEFDDWQIKRNIDAITSILDSQKNRFQKELKDSYESFWSAFVGQLRMTRNEAGHPSSVDPVDAQTVHSSLLIFPQLAKLAYDLKSWVSTNYP